MKTSLIPTLWIITCLHSGMVFGATTLYGDGSDGDFAPSGTNVVDLSKAVTGVWSDDNSAHRGDGVYDPDKWAVVFKYRSINIPKGCEITFRNHRTRAPVVWLVDGPVTIQGTVSLNGQAGLGGTDNLVPPEPGPGGYRGGANSPAGNGVGMGWGGDAYHAEYAAKYGNPEIRPLYGGSGGLAPGVFSGGGGGGALLIVASGSVTLDGTITANGGGDGGSGGAVKIIAETVTGAGEINCLRDGRIRIETILPTPDGEEFPKTFPETIAVRPDSRGVLVWPEENAPQVRVVRVGGNPPREDPDADILRDPDVAIQTDLPAVVEIETRNFPIEGVVALRVAPKFHPQAAYYPAYFIEGNAVRATWHVTNVFRKGFSTLLVRATVP